jgi:sucrose-6-phosphate hydrolase SacC (GH32 family)
MVLWVELEHHNTIRFLTSPNLKDWTMASQINDFFECPDFFELPVDGNPANKKWVLTAASSEYQAGTFDGRTFTPETSKLHGVWSGDFYAAQTYSDIPANDGRRIQIGWLRAPSPGMPFNQCMSVPLELKLVSTPEGLRLTRLPVRELEQLRSDTKNLGSFSLKAGDANPLAHASGELLDLRAEFEPDTDSIVDFNIRGANISYDAAHQKLTVNGHRVPAPLRVGRQRLIILMDRTTVEVFASDGLTCVPLAFQPKAGELGLSVQMKSGAAKFASLQVHNLKSIWK